MTQVALHCPLCEHAAEPFHADRRRAYFRCPRCELVFADPASRPDPAAEKAHYDLHENDPADAGYRQFLSRLATPLLRRLSPGMRGLDYGCGPGPTLSVMLEEAGMQVDLYDPFYEPDVAPLSRTYDFVTCTETVEHFHHPAWGWRQMAGLVRPGGWLGVMTKLVIDHDRFTRWHYKNDPTHVSFYCPATFEYLAQQHHLTAERVADDVYIFQKRSP